MMAKKTVKEYQCKICDNFCSYGGGLHRHLILHNLKLNEYYETSMMNLYDEIEWNNTHNYIKIYRRITIPNKKECGKAAGPFLSIMFMDVRIPTLYFTERMLRCKAPMRIKPPTQFIKWRLLESRYPQLHTILDSDD